MPPLPTLVEIEWPETVGETVTMSGETYKHIVYDLVQLVSYLTDSIEKCGLVDNANSKVYRKVLRSAP